MVAEHRHDRDADGKRELLRQHMSLFRQPVIRQIAAEQKNVRLLVDAREQSLQRTLRCLLDMQIADCSQARCLLTVQLESPRMRTWSNLHAYRPGGRA